MYPLILDMGNAEDTPLILGHLSLTLQMLAYKWLMDKSNSTLLEEKGIFDFASGQPHFDEKQEKTSEENQDEETKANLRAEEAYQEEEE
jgi:hypothetical protein